MCYLIAVIVGCAVGAGEAQPQWVAPEGPGEAWVFEDRFQLDAQPDRVLVRLNARDAYRLIVNDAGVGLADTPFDGETWDVTPFLCAGENRVAVEATAQRPEVPENCWVVVEAALPTALMGHSLDLLRFDTRGAMGDEWVYVELLDDSGLSSGYYCLEKGHHDFLLGNNGADSVHTVRLAEEERLASADGFSLKKIRVLRLRFDQKKTTERPEGRVILANVILGAGARRWTLDLSPSAWTVSGGHGPWHRARLAPEAGGMALSYDFRAVGQPALVC